MVSAWLGRRHYFWYLLFFAFTAGELAAGETSPAWRTVERAREAAERLDYAGILVNQQGPSLHTSRIIHKHQAKEAEEEGSSGSKEHCT